MSFDYPQQPRRKKGGISGIVMLLLIGLGLFVFMNMRGAGSGANSDSGVVDQGRQSAGSRSGGKLDPHTNRELQEIDEDRRMREHVFGSGESKSQSASNAKAMPSGAGAGNSDWSIEDVDGKKKSISSSAKKTQGADGWSIEEVPTEKKSGTGVELNKSGGGDVELTEKSDWSVEDVDPKAKKTTEGDWSVEEVEGGGK